MALSPIQQAPNVEIKESRKQIASSKTYHFNFDTGEMKGFVDSLQAIKQYIRKALCTPRFRYLIYDDQYGSELEELIGKDVSNEFIFAEIPRLVREALIYDDRITDVKDVKVKRQDDAIYVSFQVETYLGSIQEEVKL
ncbi:DUF2634 domain-containing protein [Longirhabdus pacifica]|uniref:DUF2634 domain-containing protein n=1 Tax=Longirhabdus pacifica TaxID=2305227 RepID=UPI001008D95C|nr:DUF2634 domain-containing protein [Longirhabdus pacifica]